MRLVFHIVAAAIAFAAPISSVHAGPGSGSTESPVTHVERTIETAGNARRNGGCYQRDWYLEHAAKQIELLEFYARRIPGGPISANAIRDARRALADERARTCTNNAQFQAIDDAADQLPSTEGIPPAQSTTTSIEDRYNEARARLREIRDAENCDVTQAIAWFKRLRQIADEAEEVFRGAVRAGPISQIDPLTAFDRWRRAQRELHRWDLEVRIMRIHCARQQPSQDGGSGGQSSPGGGGAPPDEGWEDAGGPGGSGGNIGNNPVNIDDYAQDSYRPGRFSANIGIRGGQTAMPRTGIGFRREGAPGTAPEEFAALTPDTFFTIGGGIGADLGDFGLRASYLAGDGSTSFDIAPGGGIDSGIVYGGPAPSGSSGLATPFGLSGAMDIEFSQFSAGASLPLFRERTGNTAYYGGFALNYHYLDRDYLGTAAGSGTSQSFTFEFSQLREQSLEEHIVELGYSGKFIFNANGDVRPFIATRAFVYYIDTDLDSIERNLSNFGPPDDQDFTLRYNRSDNDIGFHGGISAGVFVPLNDNVSIVIGGEVDYLSTIGAIFNPNSGDQVFFDGLTTDLRNDDSLTWSVGVGVSIGLGN